MSKTLKPALVPGIIEKRIFYLRGKRVILDFDLAELYRVETGNLKRAVKRNKERFPKDFVFELNRDEEATLICQTGTSKKEKRGGSRYKSFAFTEQGVAMLSSVLRSKKAVEVNVQIMRTFVALREILLTNEQLRLKIEKMEKKYDQQFQAVFAVIKKLIQEEEKPKGELGFG